MYELAIFAAGCGVTVSAQWAWTRYGAPKFAEWKAKLATAVKDLT